MPERTYDLDLLKDLLHSSVRDPGVFGRAIGFGSGTGAYKEVHLMNDLAQCVLGGGPAHRGDHLCMVIREDKHPAEPTSDADLRADQGSVGAAYRAAFPPDLAPDKVSRLRAAVREVLASDGGIYAAKTSMASGLATHQALLGAEGFRRFQLGRYLQAVLGEDGQDRLRELYTDDTDPITRFLRPLLTEAELVETHPAPAWRPPPCAFDEALGRRLTTLLTHPLSKPTLLRLFALTVSLGLTLRVLGAGSPSGRPIALLLPHTIPPGRRPLREEAVQCFQRGVDGLHRRLAELLPEHPRADELWTVPKRRKGANLISAPDGPNLAAAAPGLLAAARDAKTSIYWPEEFVMPLARRSGCLLPKSRKAGWKPYMVLTPDHLEALILMYVPPGARPKTWRAIWAEVQSELGIVIGAGGHADAERLRAAGVLHVNMQQLSQNSETLLSRAVTRGVARRLPDSGAEAGGELT